MKKQITHFGVLQSSKVLAILGCIVSAVYALPLGLIELYNHANDLAIVILVQPFVHLIVGFITGLVAFFLYNQIAKVFGGIEITTEDKQ